jgi:hypothetical protein
MVLANLANNEVLEAQFNPTDFEETVGVNWARQTVPGLSHQVKQFINTKDVQFKLELFNRVSDGGPAELARIKDARKFLYAACHPRRAQSLVGGGAPRLLFVWPKLITLTCVIDSLTFKYTRFNIEGDPVSYTSTLVLEEIRDVVVTMEDILDLDTHRTASGAAIWEN